MDAKEKAKQLVERFIRVEDDSQFYWQPYDDIPYIDSEVLPHAKKCALIVIEEILTNSKQTILFISSSEDLVCDNDYWNEVKMEINAL